MFVRTGILILAGLSLVALPSPVRAAAQDAAVPTLVVRVKSIDSVLEDVKFLAAIAGQKDQAQQQLDQALKTVLPNGFEGIDTKRPLGVYGRVDESLLDSSAVALVPVTDNKAFLALIERVTKVKPKQEGEYYVIAPEGAPLSVYMRFANKYAYATIRDKSAIEPSKMIAPEKLFGGMPGTISANLRIDQIPDVFKQIVVGQLELRISDLEDQKTPGETPSQRALKIQAAKEITKQLTSLIKEGGAVSMDLGVDHKNQSIQAQLGLAGKAESELAGSIATLGASTSLFGGLATSDSAAKMIVHLALPESIRKAAGPVIDEAIRTNLEKEQDQAKRALGEKVLKTLSPTLKSGELDMAFDMAGPSATGHYSLLIGLKVREGTEIEKVARELAAQLPEKDKAQVTLDADSAGSVKIHRLNIEKHLDEDAKKTFGEHPFFVAARNDAVFIAGGEGGLSALKAGLNASPRPAPQMAVSLSAARLAQTMVKTNPNAPEVAKKVFTTKDSDKLQLTISGGKALTVQFAVKAQVLKFFAELNQKSTGAK